MMLRCAFCRKCTAVKLWKCACNICWYRCAVHRHSIGITQEINCSNFSNNRRKSTASYAARKMRKAAQQPATFADMLADDLRLAEIKASRRETLKRLRDIPLGNSKLRYVRPRLLGPVLRMRFSGNAATANQILGCEPCVCVCVWCD